LIIFLLWVPFFAKNPENIFSLFFQACFNFLLVPSTRLVRVNTPLYASSTGRFSTLLNRVAFDTLFSSGPVHSFSFSSLPVVILMGFVVESSMTLGPVSCDCCYARTGFQSSCRSHSLSAVVSAAWEREVMWCVVQCRRPS